MSVYLQDTALINHSVLYQKVLAAHGASKVSAYVTHGVFPKGSWDRFVHKKDGSNITCSRSPRLLFSL